MSKSRDLTENLQKMKIKNLDVQLESGDDWRNLVSIIRTAEPECLKVTFFEDYAKQLLPRYSQNLKSKLDANHRLVSNLEKVLFITISRIEFEPETYNYRYLHDSDDSDEFEGPTDKIQEVTEMFELLRSEKLVVVGPMVLLIFFGMYVKHQNLYLELKPGIEVNDFSNCLTSIVRDLRRS